MKTDVISIYSDLQGRSKAMAEAERFTEYLHLNGKNAMHLRLLAEEAIGMVHGIVQDFKGDFWLESEKTDNGITARITISADVDVSDRQEEMLLNVSTTGKNEEAKGIMGKIRQLLRWSIQHTEDEQEIKESWFDMGCYSAHTTGLATGNYYWSLANYRNSVNNDPQSDQDQRDELEKSIIAKLADEVRVGIRSGKAEVIIEKNFPNAQ